MRLEWDDAKNLANQKNHGLSFEEASKLFTSDAECLEVFDHLHSDTEDRFITIGPIQRGLFMVVWTERVEDVVRIISVRFATKREAQRYHAYLEQL